MSEPQFIIISIIERILGSPKNSFEGIKQYEFNCPSPICKGDNKHNWTFNAEKNVFRCWKCNYKGIIHKIEKQHTANPQNSFNQMLQYCEDERA